MDFAELSRWIPKVEKELQTSYRSARRESGPEFRSYLDVLEEFSLRGGKRFRALMVLAGFHVVGGRDPRPAVPAAAAMEHFQSWMLVHDDIIDHAEERRGGPAVHRALAAAHRASGRLGSADEVGIGLGITLGDLEEPFTVRSILAAPVGADRRVAAIGEYARMARWTALGQALDIANGTRPVSEVRESDVLLVHRLKSAVYTVASPLRIGAMLAGGKPGLLEALDRFGTDIGVAFQLRDDVLGAGFDASAAGKSANDLVEGKRTLLVVRAWERADASGRAAISAALGVPGASPSQVEAAREVIRSTGSLAYSEARIERLAARASSALGRNRAFSARARSLLDEIGERLVHRST